MGIQWNKLLIVPRDIEESFLEGVTFELALKG